MPSPSCYRGSHLPPTTLVRRAALFKEPWSSGHPGEASSLPGCLPAVHGLACSSLSMLSDTGVCGQRGGQTRGQWGALPLPAEVDGFCTLSSSAVFRGVGPYAAPLPVLPGLGGRLWAASGGKR